VQLVLSTGGCYGRTIHSAINRTPCESQRLAPQEARTVCFVEDNPEGRSAHVSMCCKGLGEDYERSSAVDWSGNRLQERLITPGSRPSRSTGEPRRQRSLGHGSMQLTTAHSAPTLETTARTKGKLKFVPRHVDYACLVHRSRIMSYRRAHALLQLQRYMPGCRAGSARETGSLTNRRMLLN